jgi:methylglutaconyl-CoA hydratase
MLLTDLADGILTLTLNRPDKRNALSSALLESLSLQLERADLDHEVRVVVIRGAGKDFCAGADLDELLASADKTPAENEAAALTLGNVFLQMRKIPKPVVAVLHGRALAGGAGIVTGCDIALAQESARIGYPEIQRGFVPAMVMTMLRRAVGEKLAFDLAATGRVLTATEAASAGLISRVFPDEEFEVRVAEVVRGLAGAGSSAIALTKRQFYQLDGMEFEAGIRLGAQVNALSRATPEFRQAISAFLKKE